MSVCCRLDAPMSDLFTKYFMFHFCYFCCGSISVRHRRRRCLFFVLLHVAAVTVASRSHCHGRCLLRAVPFSRFSDFFPLFVAISCEMGSLIFVCLCVVRFNFEPHRRAYDFPFFVFFAQFSVFQLTLFSARRSYVRRRVFALIFVVALDFGYLSSIVKFDVRLSTLFRSSAR